MITFEREKENPQLFKIQARYKMKTTIKIKDFKLGDREPIVIVDEYNKENWALIDRNYYYRKFEYTFLVDITEKGFIVQDSPKSKPRLVKTLFYDKYCNEPVGTFRKDETIEMTDLSVTLYSKVDWH